VSTHAAARAQAESKPSRRRLKRNERADLFVRRVEQVRRHQRALAALVDHKLHGSERHVHHQRRAVCEPSTRTQSGVAARQATQGSSSHAASPAGHAHERKKACQPSSRSVRVAQLSIPEYGELAICSRCFTVSSGVKMASATTVAHAPAVAVAAGWWPGVSACKTFLTA